MPAPVETDPRAGTRVAPDRLHAWIRRAFERMGVPPDDAEAAAATLLAADVRGVESHGVARLPYYHAKIVAGTMDPAAELTVERESAATLVLDSHSGIGLVHAARAMARTVAKAEAGGLCMTTVRHANHFGIAGAHALAAARAGLAAIATTNATPLVVPTYGAEGMLGTNPIAFAVPTGPVGSGAPPLVVDLASSTVAWGKIEIARRDGKPVPTERTFTFAPATCTTAGGGIRILCKSTDKTAKAVFRTSPAANGVWKFSLKLAKQAIPSPLVGPATAILTYGDSIDRVGEVTDCVASFTTLNCRQQL